MCHSCLTSSFPTFTSLELVPRSCSMTHLGSFPFIRGLTAVLSFHAVTAVPDSTSSPMSPSLPFSSPRPFSFFFRGDLDLERDFRDFRFSFRESLGCARDRLGDSPSSSGSICSLSSFSTLGFLSSFLPSFSRICSNDFGICAR